MIILGIAPVAEQTLGRTGHVLNEIALCVALIVGVWSLHKTRTWFVLGAVLAIAGVVLTSLRFFIPGAVTILATIAVMLSFFVLTTVVAARQLLAVGPVDFNRVVGGICVYLLLGLIWATLYLFLHTLDPQSFTGVTSSDVSFQLQEFVYYSFVTLTTLGYGEISPLSPPARTLAYVEAVCGQFYIAILVAGLVGLHLAHRQPDEKA